MHLFLIGTTYAQRGSLFYIDPRDPESTRLLGPLKNVERQCAAPNARSSCRQHHTAREGLRQYLLPLVAHADDLGPFCSAPTPLPQINGAMPGLSLINAQRMLLDIENGIVACAFNH
jgi:hypothetical protein